MATRSHCAPPSALIWLMSVVLVAIVQQTIAHQQSNLTACQHQRLSSEKRARALVSADEDARNVRLPRCLADGRFEPVQCDNDTGQCWCVDEGGFELGGTRAGAGKPINCTSPRPCAGHLCRMLCPFEFQLDDEGCPLCRCRDPCLEVRCPRGTQCQLEEVKCTKDPCPPVATCKQPRSLDDACPLGKALTLTERGKAFLCGNDPSKPQCPMFFDCEILPGMDYGVCCPSPDKLVKPGTCPNVTLGRNECGEKCSHDMECQGLDKCCRSPECGLTCMPMAENTPCLQQKILAELLSMNERDGQGYVPQCGPEGHFQPRQCSRNGKVCWCVDSDGYKLARTMDRAEFVRCDLRSRNDVLGQSLDTCDNVICPKACPLGYKSDNQGCQTCDCADLCENIECPTGMECVIVEDVECIEDPCDSYAICRPPPILYAKPGTCPPADIDQCRNVTCNHDRDCIDAQKCCQTTMCGKTCLEPPKVSQRLPTMCEYVRDFESNAVDGARARSLALHRLTCRADGSYETLQCHQGDCWCVDEFGAEIGGSRLAERSRADLDCNTTMRKKGCNGLLCRLGCDYGFQYDDGCPVCGCRDACESVNCSAGQECQMIEVDCLGGFCPSVPQCVEAEPSTLTCPAGVPARHHVTNITRLCSTSASCPKTHFCNRGGDSSISGLGVCCEKIVKAGQCPYRFQPKYGHCENDSQCEGDHQCGGTQKCCSDGCLSTCVEPEMKTGCEHHAEVARFMLSQKSVSLGEFHVPECENDDGRFSDVQCDAAGQRCWCVDQAGSEKPGTRTKYGQRPNCTAPKTKLCSELASCKLDCPHGFKLDNKGCGTCACHNPCDDILCSRKNEECRLVSVNCITEPCPRIPMCVPMASNPCSFGEPLKGRKCSSLPGQSSCPSTHVCLYDPIGANEPVCCPKSRNSCYMDPEYKKCDNGGNQTKWVFDLARNKCALSPGCPTSTNLFFSQQDCESTCPPLSECQMAREKAIHISKKVTGFGFVPKCTKEGGWETMQCLPEVGLCWCVTSGGDYVKGSGVRGTPRCGSARMGRKLEMGQPDAEGAQLNEDEVLLEGRDGAGGAPLVDNGLVCADGEAVHACNATLCQNKVCLSRPNAVCRVDPCNGCRYQFYVGQSKVDCQQGLTACQRDVQSVLNSEAWSLHLGVMLGTSLMPDSIIGGVGSTPTLLTPRLGELDMTSSELDLMALETTLTADDRSDITVEEEQEEMDTQPSRSLSMLTMPPRCSPTDGGYEPTQSQGQLSWCVSTSGEPRHDTLTRGLVRCDANGQAVSRKSLGPVCPMDPERKPRVCVDACSRAKCPAHPEALCLADPCDDCSISFALPSSGETVRCDHKCSQPLEVGMCRAAFPRYFYNATSASCESFVYGGCLGNENNFESEAECRAECSSATTPFIGQCDLPKRVGPCRASQKRWWYDAEAGRCERFVYGGCDGNANNFETEEHCAATCPDLVLCPRLDVVRQTKVCPRAALCANRTCASQPEAVCTVDPCDCGVYFVDYDGKILSDCSATTTATSTQSTTTIVTSGSTSPRTISTTSTQRTSASTIKSSETSSKATEQRTPIGLSACSKARDWALSKRSLYVPQCDADGHFNATQCQDESKSEGSKCWCVDRMGRRLPDSPSFQRGTNKCKTVDIESVGVNLVFFHNTTADMNSKKPQVVSEAMAVLQNLTKSDAVPNLNILVIPEVGLLRVEFNLTGSDKIEVAYSIQGKMESGELILPMNGLNLRADALLSAVNPRPGKSQVLFGSSTEDAEDDNDAEATFYSQTTIVMATVFSFLTLITLALIVVFIVNRRRNRGFYPSSSTGSLASINNRVYDMDQQTKVATPKSWSDNLSTTVPIDDSLATPPPVQRPIGVSSVEHEYEVLRYKRGSFAT